MPANDRYDMAWWPDWCDQNQALLFEVQDTRLDYQKVYQVAAPPAGGQAPGAALSAATPVELAGFIQVGAPRCQNKGKQVVVSALRSLAFNRQLYSFALDDKEYKTSLVGQTGFPTAGNSSWSGNDSWLVLMNEPPGVPRFSLLRVEWEYQTDFTAFALPPRVTEARYPAVSPRNGDIAFACAASGKWHLCATDSIGRSFRFLLEDLVVKAQRPAPQKSVTEVTPSWSPDGQWLLYASNKGGSWDIYLYSEVGADDIRPLDIRLPFNQTWANQFQPGWSKP
jgi:Tol biopolymer transport system component